MGPAPPAPSALQSGQQAAGGLNTSTASSGNNWNTVGGNTLLAGNVTSWVETVRSPMNWATIVYDEVPSDGAVPNP